MASSASSDSSASQEELSMNSIISLQVSSPEPSVTHSSPTPTPPYLDKNGVQICSAPDTCPSSASSGQFKTPPEEHCRSSSEEPPSPRGGKRVIQQAWSKQSRASGESSSSVKANTPAAAEVGGATVNMDVETQVLGSMAGEKEDGSDNAAIVLEALKLLAAAEQKLNADDDCGATGDFFETAKKFGMVFPEPTWWKDLKKD